MKALFRKFSAEVSRYAGSANAFVLALVLITVWAVTGPLFAFSNTWQLVINTTTTIITFLMVFLIQNTQNRDGKAMQLKLDELIRSSRARDSFIDLEGLTDDELDALDQQFRNLHHSTHATPELKKLHTRIAATRQQRHILKGPAEMAEQVVDLLNPFSSRGSSHKQ